MCGIVGYLSVRKDFKTVDFAAANNMVKYRGPDDYGYITLDSALEVSEWKDEDLKDMRRNDQVMGAFGFRRLSILDLSAYGHQPMHEGGQRYWIVYNGEVYNYIEIRRELEELGHSFVSATDTEVVLKSYIEWGCDCLHRFNGMWSFCILDRNERKLFCARDRLGIKPFYYYFDGERFIFGSEVKQIITLLPGDARINTSVYFDFLALGSYGNESRETFFRDIYKLLPGEFLEVDLSRKNGFSVKHTPWWDLPMFVSNGAVDERKVYGDIRVLLEDSIRIRLRSDVELGTCLSGGLDSSGIVRMVDRIGAGGHGAGRHKVFVIGSTDPRVDETKYAKLVIGKSRVEPFFGSLVPVDIERELEDFIWHQDEPLLRASIFGGWSVYRLARKCGTTVVLDGQGSDELLGGYYKGPHIDLLGELAISGRFGEFLTQLGENSALYGTGWTSLLRRVALKIGKRAARSVLPVDFRPAVLRSVGGWLNMDFVRENISSSPLLNRGFFPRSRKFSSWVKKESYELTRFTNLPGILRQVDRNSMAFSVEARVPFLDHRLVEYIFELPANMILRNGYTKYAYRQAMKGIIPERIRLRTDKRGFEMPDRQLLNGAKRFVGDVVERLSGKSSIFDVHGLRKNILTAISSEDSYRPIVWRILNGIIWQDRFKVGV
ncbi:MAG: asparagine synthase (glutamine-hydrolyzing) [candidate division WOR-3 bacterium]|nr:MAG: asparagine synthase (glutamine-hydrolyzing) [candidate division WOR-3 bacterium]